MPKYTKQFAPQLRPDGSVIDSAESSSYVPTAGLARGSILRGVVFSVKPYDGTYPGIRCQVYIYSTYSTACGLLSDVIVTQSVSSIAGGQVHIPSPTTRSLVELEGLKGNKGFNPNEVDGDHVLVGFIDGLQSLPAIIAYLNHPKTDEDKDPSSDPIGYRVLPREEDGLPMFTKHLGSFQGFDTSANYICDTRKGHKEPDANPSGTASTGGGLTNVGVEVSSTETSSGEATSGNYTVKLKQNAKLLIEFEGGANSIQLTDNDGVLDITTSSTVNINADSVDVGNAATEAALLGTTYRSQESALMTTIQTQLTALSAALVPLAASPATPVTNGALVGLLSGPLAAINTAISTFEGASSSYLSSKVDIG